MKNLKQENYKQANDQLVKDEKGKVLTTKELIIIVLKNSRYKTTADQMQAFAIFTKPNEKLKLEGDKGKQFVKIEDADFELINKLVESYEPIKVGLTFAPFLEALKIANQ